LWSEWGRLTRFLESARIALARESRLWQTLELQNAADAKVRVDAAGAAYEVTLDQHRAALGDDWLLFAQVLIYSYALAESAAADKLGFPQVPDGGIEVWGRQLLTVAGNAWADVKDGQAGCVEVAVVRNIIAHGDQVYSPASINRLAAAGIAGKQPGYPVLLDYAILREYRARLKSLLRAGQV
jgi:hypothetical protein